MKLCFCLNIECAAVSQNIISISYLRCNCQRKIFYYAVRIAEEYCTILITLLSRLT